MARKDAILNLRQVLIKRRDALRKALAGDLSMLKELREQSSSDVIDAACSGDKDTIADANEEGCPLSGGNTTGGGGGGAARGKNK